MRPVLRGWNRFLEDSSFLREGLWKYRGFVAVGLLSLVLVDLLELVPPLLLKWSVDVAMADGSPEEARAELLKLALIYMATAFLQGLGRYGWRMYLVRASFLAGRDFRGKFGQHLFGMSAHFFDRRRIGDLMSMSTQDVDAVRIAIGPGFLVFADAMFYFFTVPVAMWMLSPQLTWLAFLPLPLIPWFVMRNEREIHDRFEKVQESFGAISAMAQESLGGIRVIKAFAREDAQLGRIAKAGEEHILRSLRLARVQSAFGPTLDFFMSLGLVLLLYFGGSHVITGAVSLGTFVAFQRYIQKMIWPMTAVGLSITYYQRAVASSKRMKELFAEKSNVPEPEHPVLPATWKPGAPNAPWKTEGRLEFRNLHFRYPGTEAHALHGVSFTVEPGQRVALVGSIGSGKSALLGLVPRLYPVERGMLLIDGVDVGDWPLETLREQVGYVSQEIFLFSETVTENVAYGLAASMLSRESETRVRLPVEEATKLSSVHEDVLNLVEGYGTRLGEGGVNLSGGQKQRLTIARAIAKQPAILVLDDALSSVDTRTEEGILRGLRARPGRNTELIAAHRISTIRDADRIIVLEHGRVRQAGTHDELLQERDGIYRRFHEQQRLKEDLEAYVEGLAP
jgi:ATP-binding cassette subfamily B protein